MVSSLSARENHGFTVTVSAGGHECVPQGVQTAGHHESSPSIPLIINSNASP